MKPIILTAVIFIAMTTNSTAVTALGKALLACPSSPNCVSSQAATGNDHFIAPFKIKGVSAKAWAGLKTALLAQSRTVITQESADTLHAEATSLVFRFVDDIDAILDANAGLIHIRSASRTGYWDFGVNRQRVETLQAEMRKVGVVE